MTKYCRLWRQTTTKPSGVEKKNAYQGLQQLKQSSFIGKKQDIARFVFELSAIYQIYYGVMSPAELKCSDIRGLLHEQIVQFLRIDCSQNHLQACTINIIARNSTPEHVQTTKLDSNKHFVV